MFCTYFQTWVCDAVIHVVCVGAVVVGAGGAVELVREGSALRTVRAWRTRDIKIILSELKLSYK